MGRHTGKSEAPQIPLLSCGNPAAHLPPSILQAPLAQMTSNLLDEICNRLLQN
jgi:hypothetical protein